MCLSDWIVGTFVIMDHFEINLFPCDRSHISNDKNPIVLMTNFVFDHSNFASGDYDLTNPEHLYKIKENPNISKANLQSGNLKEIKREIDSLNKFANGRPIYLLDTSQTENFASLLSLSKELDSAIFRLAYSSKSYSHFFANIANKSPSTLALCQILMDAQIRKITSQLIVGESPPSIDVHNEHLTVRSGFLVCQLASPYFTSNPPIPYNVLEMNTCQLKVCGIVHSEIRTKYPHCGLPLLVVGCGPFSTFHEHAIALLQEYGADISRVMFNQIILTYENVSFYERLLQTYPTISLCVDTFTHQTQFSVPFAADFLSSVLPSASSSTAAIDSLLQLPHYPSDQELIECVIYLVRRSPSIACRLSLSLEIKTKLQLQTYGGSGYSYYLDTLLQRFQQPYPQHRVIRAVQSTRLVKNTFSPIESASATYFSILSIPTTGAVQTADSSSSNGSTDSGDLSSSSSRNNNNNSTGDGNGDSTEQSGRSRGNSSGRISMGDNRGVGGGGGGGVSYESGSRAGGQGDGIALSSSSSSSSGNVPASGRDLATYALSDTELDALFGGNLLRQLPWYKAAKVVIEYETPDLTCHICQKEFVQGKGYSKYAFEYCSSACLTAHRQKDFK